MVINVLFCVSRWLDFSIWCFKYLYDFSATNELTSFSWGIKACFWFADLARVDKYNDNLSNSSILNASFLLDAMAKSSFSSVNRLPIPTVIRLKPLRLRIFAFLIVSILSSLSPSVTTIIVLGIPNSSARIPKSSLNNLKLAYSKARAVFVPNEEKLL